jgi:hypothetical protein
VRPSESKRALERGAQLSASLRAESRFVTAECHLQMDVGDVEDAVPQS